MYRVIISALVGHQRVPEWTAVPAATKGRLDGYELYSMCERDRHRAALEAQRFATLEEAQAEATRLNTAAMRSFRALLGS